jgi:hypothetical protein
MSNTIQINVVSILRKTSTYTVCPTDTVMSLKERIQNKEGIPPDQQRLIHDGTTMDEGEGGMATLEDVSICVLCLTDEEVEADCHFVA